jgi:hypothetical protein
LVPIFALQNAPRRESVADEYNPFRRARLAITLAWFLRGWKKVGVPWKSRLGFENPRHGHLLAVPGNGYDLRHSPAQIIEMTGYTNEFVENVVSWKEQRQQVTNHWGLGWPKKTKKKRR